MPGVLVCVFLITTASLFYQGIPDNRFDTIIRHGTIYDGSGHEPFVRDIGINADTISAIGDLSGAVAKTEINAKGLAVAPGFINMLSMAERSLLLDGRSMSDIKQGVTLEVMGEGWSAGPAKRNLKKPVDSLWTTLDGYFQWQMKKGSSTNIASFVGATTVRNYVLEKANRAPTAEELKQMKLLVHEAMRQGAMGLSTSLIYAPADYAKTEEIIALARVASESGGLYITHMRSESEHILNALNETYRISK